MANKLTFAQVSQLLKCDPETGKLFWLERPRSLFASQQACSKWNNLYPGKEAFVTSRPDGYLSGGIFNKSYLAHRICWLMFYELWPEDQIDHINGNKRDNRVINLRSVTDSQNKKNRPKQNNSISGVAGVNFNPLNNNWVAKICVDKKYIHIGCYYNIHEAIAARKDAEIRYGFHPNHGR